MIKILIVEDNASKARDVVREIKSNANVEDESIEIVDNSKDAKKRLSKTRYDLMILDMNLPKRIGEDPSKSEGITVLNFIKTNKKAIQPDFVVGLTLFDEEYLHAMQSFNSMVFKLLKFDDEGAWKPQVRNAVDYLVSKDFPPYFNDGQTYHTDIGVVCALDEELDSVLALFNGWETIKVIGDSTSYNRVYVKVGERLISIVAAACPKMGLSFASTITTKMIMSFRPKYFAMTGICAGVRDKTNYGDILIADPIFDWGGGKWVSNPGDDTLRFRPAPYPWRLDEDFKEVLKEIATRENLNQITDDFTGDKPNKELAVHIDAMASGGSVLQANRLMEDVREQHKNLIGIEMETYGVFTAAKHVSNPKPICFSIKSVCDFGDEDKNDDYHDYASYTSAKFLTLVINKVFSDEY